MPCSSIAVNLNRPAGAAVPGTAADCPFGFACLLGVTVVLLVRPSEIVPALAALPIYQILIVSTLLGSVPVLSRLLTVQSLQEQPITICVLGLLGAAVASHLANGSIYFARMTFSEFGKVVLYYLLLVGLVTTPNRLRMLLTTVVGAVAMLAGIAVAQYHGILDLPSLSMLNDSMTDPVTGEAVTIRRMRSVGIFNDPNDLSMILLLGMALAAYLVDVGPGFATRASGIGVLLLGGYALSLTESRGGLLALMASAAVWCRVKFGRKAVLGFLALGLPLLLVLFAGRQTNFDVEGGTGQERVQQWSYGLALLKHHPLFGIGYDQYAEIVGLEAHNSYVSSVVETGLVGGTFFLAAVLLPCVRLYTLATADEQSASRRGRLSATSRLRHYLLAGLVAWAAGMFTLSRAYIVPTYLTIGLVAVCLHLDGGERPPNRSLWQLLLYAGLAGIGHVIFTLLFVRTFARWG